MLTLELLPETERRIAECAKGHGVSEADFVRTLIENALDDMDDIGMAIERLENALPPLSPAKAHKALGLDD